MNFTYENQGTTTFLVYSIGEEETIDTMSLGMLTNNQIDGLAPVLFTQMDNERYLKYNITAKISVSQFFSGTVTKKRILGVFRGITKALMAAEEYMLDSNSILLDFDYIFADVSTCETQLICLPMAERQQENQDMGMFFKNIVFTTQFDQTEECSYVAALINYLNSTSSFSIWDFNQLLKQLMDGGTEKKKEVLRAEQPKVVEPENVRRPEQSSATKADVQPKIVQKPQPVIPGGMQIPKGKQAAEGMKIPERASAESYIQIPGQALANAKNEQMQQETEKMSMYYLLRHFDKENLDKYKAQKADKKKASDNKKTKKAGMSIAVPGTIPQHMEVKPQISAPNYGNERPEQTRPLDALQNQMQTPPQQVQNRNFGETVDLATFKIGETTALNKMINPASGYPTLVRIKTGERIIINKPVFRIGKERSYVDYFIGDNSAISRSHANIIKKDEGYFIIDTNSTNHTYVNGGMIPSNIETQIDNGAKIMLADEKFEFYLY